MPLEDDKYVLHGPEPAEPLSQNTLGKEIFDSLLTNRCNHVAMVDVFTGRTLSYKSMLEESCNLAEALRIYGYSTNNTTLSICSENSLEFFIPVIASLFVGSIMAPVNHNYTETELRHTLNIPKPKVIFCSEAVSTKFRNLKKELKFLDKIVVIDSSKEIHDAENLKEFVSKALKGNAVLPYKFQPFVGDPTNLGAFIMCSSGTTGLPKGVLQSHLNLMVRVLQSRDPRYYANDHVNLGLMPFFHGYGLNVSLNAIINKQKIVVFRKFEEDSFLKAIQDHKVTALAIAPPLAIFLEKSAKLSNYDLSCITEIVCGAAPLSKNTEIAIKRRKFEEDSSLRAIQDHKVTIVAIAPPLTIFLEKTPKLSKYDLSCIQEIWCGAAPISKNTELAIKRRLKNVKSIRQGYGLTEATLAVTLPDKDVERYGSCGKVATYMSCKIRDPETGKSLGPNQVGEFCIKGPMVMMGYYNDEKSTKETFTADGWLKTGDLGYYDKEGFFYVVDRLKELIKYKGFQVAPAELEAILINHPKVRDVGVVGLPDELSGELPLAFIVKREGVDVTEKELQDYVAKLLSPQKRLRGGVIFVSEIPKNPSGKILRRQLRQKLKDYKGLLESKL